MLENIVIKGAKENNLKNLDICYMDWVEVIKL